MDIHINETKSIDSLDIYNRDIIEMIYEYSFNRQVINDFLLYFDSDETRYHNLYGIRSDRLFSIHAVFDAEINIRETSFMAYYLAFAAVLPQYRSKGNGRALLYDAFNRALDNNVPAVIMDPFKHSFYRKIGFASAIESYYLEIRSSALKKTAPNQTQTIFEGKLRGNSALVRNIIEIKRKICNSREVNDLFVEEYYRYIGYTDMEAICIANENKAGYAIYRRDQENSVINIIEIIWNNNIAFGAIANRILHIMNEYEILLFEAVSQKFPFLFFCDNRSNMGEDIIFRYSPIRMLRIVDLYQILIRIVDLKKITHSFVICVEDRYIERNNKAFHFSAEGLKTSAFIENADFFLTIEDITFLITGRYSVYDLVLLEKCGCVDTKLLHQVDICFGKRNTFSPGVIF